MTPDRQPSLTGPLRNDSFACAATYDRLNLDLVELGLRVALALVEEEA